jgi:hypothetical protein
MARDKTEETLPLSKVSSGNIIRDKSASLFKNPEKDSSTIKSPLSNQGIPNLFDLDPQSNTPDDKRYSENAASNVQKVEELLFKTRSQKNSSSVKESEPKENHQTISGNLGKQTYQNYDLLGLDQPSKDFSLKNPSDSKIEAAKKLLTMNKTNNKKTSEVGNNRTEKAANPVYMQVII